MVYSPAFIFSSVYSLGVFLCAGLRLGALRWFQAFLASSARPACASSFCFCSAVRLCSILGLAVVANRSVKPTRLRRAAYFLSLEIIHADFESNHSVAYRPSLGNTCGLSRFFRCYEVNFWLQKSEKFSLN